MVTDDDLDREIRSTAVDFSFGEILNLHRDGEIIIRPEYQRLFRWSNEQRSRLIESVLLSLPIPPIFLIENDNGVLELIDGLQRTSSILQFLDHDAIDQPELTLIGCDILESLNGMTYNDLPTVQKLKIKRSPIRATIINKTGDQYVKYEMFKRLNTGGSLLSAQEIRNCSSRMIDGGARFYEFIQELAKSADFARTIARLPDTYIERRGDEELVLRFFAVTSYRHGYKGNIEEWLDMFMEGTLFGRIEFSLEEERSRFERVFKVINEKVGDKAFTRFNERGEPTGRLAPAYFEAVCAAVNETLERVTAMDADDVLDRLKKVFGDADFKSVTGPGANTIEKLNSRIEIVTRIFA
jgi:Protein of unknown function DUF262